MTVDARSYKSRLADENFTKEINYKLLAGWVHAELGDGNELTVNSIDYKRSDFLNGIFGQALEKESNFRAQ